MRFNKIYLKKTGVFLTAYAAAILLSSFAMNIIVAILTTDSNISGFLALVILTSFIGSIIGLPFALMGMAFYFFTDMKIEKQKNRLFFIALLLGLTCFSIACLLDAAKIFYAFFSALCPPLVYYFVVLADRKFIR